ncbi:Src like adaptor 2 [Chelydra serpentina]|uniref:Src like adaptor 2 n=1 Tax=Chelydra serpentina TaxID=8475 RepID=A0A8T1SA23_CHESE|nr:Src like adaptor 2 [Chelydra serpentina]
MGSLPSRTKQLVIQPSSAAAMQATAPLQTGLNSYVAVALCSFPAGGEAETVLQPGEQLNVLSEDGEWWNVMSLATSKECLVPSSHVAKVWHRWLYEGVSREKAEELLLLPCNGSGSFLIRESQTRQGCYSLSVRRTNHSSWDSVKHYRINRLENGWLFIAPRLTFPSLQELVDYYSETGDGLCCLLKEPCFIQGAVRAPAQNLAPPVVVKKSALNWQELDSSALLSEAPPTEGESPVSLGLREAISSYLFLTEELPLEKGEKGSLWKSA